MLETLDRVPWADLHHAFGPAVDIPAIVRGAAGGDARALDSLFENIWHQGTVYEATPHVVPFLLELLAAPQANGSKLLVLLRLIGTGRSERWCESSAEAVACGADRYLELLNSPDQEVRTSAARTLSTCVRRASELAPRLVEHITSERDELVRAALVFACGNLGVVSAAAMESWLRDEHPAPRVAAAVVAARREGDCPAAVVRALLDDAPQAIGALDALDVAGSAGTPLKFVIQTVLSVAARLELAFDLLAAWLRHPNIDARRGAASTAEHMLHRYRTAPERLVPILAAFLEDSDPNVRYWAAYQLAACGRSARAAADALWAVVERGPLRLNEPSALALLALAKIHDPRAMRVAAERLTSFSP